MLQSNLSHSEADQLNYPQTPTYDDNVNSNHSDHHPNHKKNQWYNFSKFEKLILFCTFISIVSMAIFLVTAKINLSNSQRRLQDIDSSITQIHNNNSNLHQEIIELQNNDRLQKIAVKEKLSLNNKNIRNVGK